MAMNKSDKIFLAVLITVGVLIAVFAMLSFSDRANDCDKAGGKLVKTAEGFICAELRRVM